jgi:hypothetical protein
MTVVIIENGKRKVITYYGKYLEYKTETTYPIGPSHGSTSTNYSKIYI